MALRYANDLKAWGISVWVDQLDIHPSQRWDRTTEAALRGAQGLLLIMSARSLASENVADEIGLALEGKKLLIPVMIEPCTPPMRISRLQFIDGTRDYGAALDRCKAAIAAAGLAPSDAASSAPAVPTPRDSPGSAPTEPSYAPALIEDLSQRLTVLIGPIAPHLVERERQAASSPADLVRRLAERIPQAGDREAFLARFRNLSV